MVRLCLGCGAEIEPKNWGKYCVKCKTDGISYVCVDCGLPQTIKVAAHRLRKDDIVMRCRKCAAKTPEALAKMSKTCKQKWADRPADDPVRVATRQRFDAMRGNPENHQKRLDALSSVAFREIKRQQGLERFSDPALCEEVRQRMIKVWQDPKFRANQEQHISKRWAEGSDSKVKASASHKKLWKNNKFRLRRIALMQIDNARPEVCEKIANTMTAYMSDPAKRENISNKLKYHFKQEGVLEAMSERMRLSQARPEVRKAMSEGQRKIYATAVLADAAYDSIHRTITEFAVEGGFIHSLLRQDIRKAVEYLRYNLYSADMWTSIVTEIIAVKGSCSRADLVRVSGCNYYTLAEVCRELSIEGLTEPFDGLHMDVEGFIRKLYAGSICTKGRYDFMRNEAGNKMELDIYLPDVALAIEVNGTYWHSEQAGKNKNYHYTKSKLCRENGIRLLHVWEHEWNDTRQRSILESHIASILGLDERVLSTELIVEYRTLDDVREFFDANSIHGLCDGDYVACLSEPKTFKIYMACVIAKCVNQSYEVTRVVTKQGFSVVGGFRLLLNAVCDYTKQDSVVYYIDYAYFDKDPELSCGDFICDAVGFEHVVQRTGVVLQLWNAGVATYVHNKPKLSSQPNSNPPQEANRTLSDANNSISHTLAPKINLNTPEAIV